jgi:hypothetical protein
LKRSQKQSQIRSREPLTLTLANRGIGTLARGGLTSSCAVHRRCARDADASTGSREALGLARTEAVRARRKTARRATDLGTTVKPLDGRALTLRWTRAPARGLAVAPLGRRRSPCCSRSLARAEEDEGAGDRGGGEMELGFRGERRRGF